MPDIFNRSKLLLGKKGFENLQNKKIIVFGVGGVGSWCVESLARTGVRHITIVDADVVAPSNINRQLMATTASIGMPKVDVLAERCRDINPDIEITTIHDRYTADTTSAYDLTAYDCVIDAIDSLADKALLILNATAAKVPFFSSMGAALKIDPTKVRVAEFWSVKGCPLAAALRRKFKKNKIYPMRKFKCVYSDELLANKDIPTDTPDSMTFGKVATNGAMCHITAIFGFTLAGLAISHLSDNDEQ